MTWLYCQAIDVWAMGCILVVFTGLLEYCSVLYVSKLEQKIRRPKFLQKGDKVGDKPKSPNTSKIVIVNDIPKLEDQKDSEEVRYEIMYS